MRCKPVLDVLSLSLPSVIFAGNSPLISEVPLANHPFRNLKTPGAGNREQACSVMCLDIVSFHHRVKELASAVEVRFLVG